MMIFTVIGILVMAYMLVMTVSLYVLCKVQESDKDEVKIHTELDDYYWFKVLTIILITPVFIIEYLKYKKNNK